MKKRFMAVVLAAALSISATVTALAGTWHYNDGYWYFSDPTVGYDEDEFLTGWQWIDGYCYYLDPDESGAMAVMTITPDGFPVNEVGRMTNMYGVPYYIPGWGLTATTLGPGDYDYEGYIDEDEYYSDAPRVIYGEPPLTYPLSAIIDIDTLLNRMRRTPDTVIVQIELGGEQPEKPEEPVEKAEDPQPEPIIRVGGGTKQPEKPAEPEIEAGEQTSDPVIRSGARPKQSEHAEEKKDKDPTEKPAEQPQKSEEGSEENAAGSGRAQGRPGNGNAARNRGGSHEIDPDLLFLLGLEEE